MLRVVLLGFMTSSLLSILANHNQASNIWLDRLNNIIQSIVLRLGDPNGTPPPPPTISQKKKKNEKKMERIIL